MSLASLTLTELSNAEAINHRVQRRLELLTGYIDKDVHDIVHIDLDVLSGKNRVLFGLEFDPKDSGTLDIQWHELPIAILTSTEDEAIEIVKRVNEENREVHKQVLQALRK